MASAVPETFMTAMICKDNDAADGDNKEEESSVSSGTVTKSALGADGAPRERPRKGTISELAPQILIKEI